MLLVNFNSGFYFRVLKEIFYWVLIFSVISLLSHSVKGSSFFIMMAFFTPFYIGLFVAVLIRNKTYIYEIRAYQDKFIIKYESYYKLREVITTKDNLSLLIRKNKGFSKRTRSQFEYLIEFRILDQKITLKQAEYGEWNYETILLFKKLVDENKLNGTFEKYMNWK